MLAGISVVLTKPKSEQTCFICLLLSPCDGFLFAKHCGRCIMNSVLVIVVIWDRILLHSPGWVWTSNSSSLSLLNVEVADELHWAQFLSSGNRSLCFLFCCAQIFLSMFRLFPPTEVHMSPVSHSRWGSAFHTSHVCRLLYQGFFYQECCVHISSPAPPTMTSGFSSVSFLS